MAVAHSRRGWLACGGALWLAGAAASAGAGGAAAAAAGAGTGTGLATQPAIAVRDADSTDLDPGLRRDDNLLPRRDDKLRGRTIGIEAMRFEPETVTVARGDIVTWVNRDPFPHTATRKGAFDSRAIAAGSSWRFTAREAGEYEYICTLHPGMKGTLIVR